MLTCEILATNAILATDRPWNFTAVKNAWRFRRLCVSYTLNGSAIFFALWSWDLIIFPIGFRFIRWNNVSSVDHFCCVLHAAS
jgi:hypothetical protein